MKQSPAGQATGYYNYVGDGGFGGGGSNNNHPSGGGGGYSGGGGSGSYYAAGGGGSYNSGANQVNEAGVQTGHGLVKINSCLLYTSPSPRDKRQSRMPSSA